MRWWCLLAVISAGCSFNIQGTPVGGGSDPGATSPSGSPPSSIPDQPDMSSATTPPANPPPPTPPGPGSADMARQRVGTACTSDAQCDPGLTCAQTFFVGLTKIDIPGGYCTHECSNSTCPANSYCGTLSFGKYCLSSCPPDPCRKGYECCDNSNQKACLPNNLCGQGD